MNIIIIPLDICITSHWHYKYALLSIANITIGKTNHDFYVEAITIIHNEKVPTYKAWQICLVKTDENHSKCQN